MSATTTTSSAVPNDRDAHNDRTLRLWGKEAQALLDSAHVLLLGATATGCEILKNLILPGLGNFTVCDGAKVSHRDLGNNFFLEQTDEGQSRAPAVTKILQELNPEYSKGNYIEKDPNVAIPADIDPKKYTLVIATNLVSQDKLVELSKHCASHNIPCVFSATNGLMGLLRIQSPARHIVHTMPDIDLKVSDLRPLNPFPELLEFFNRNDPSDQSIEIEAHSHLPFFLLIHFAVRIWRKENNHPEDKVPGLFDWKAIKVILIDKMMRRKSPVQDNFLDARDACSAKLLVKNRNFPELNRILKDPRAAAPSAKDDVFWFLAHGLVEFKKANNDDMPLPGTIPDFTATTASYKELQHIFRARGDRDAAAVHAAAVAALEKAGRKKEEISYEEAKVFTEHAWELNYVTYPLLHEEISSGKLDVAKFTNTDSSAWKWYVAYRAAETFAQGNKGVWPGDSCGSSADKVADLGPVKEDLAKVSAIATTLLGAQGDDQQKKYLEAMVAAGASETVSMASIVGAVSSQECIKLIQNRRVPVQHTVIYDGIENTFTTIGCPQ